MITLRRAADRHHEWIQGQEYWSTFDESTALNSPPEAFGGLLALVENRIPPGAGGESRSRNGDDILSYVFRGVLVQEDAKGYTNLLQNGEFQRASAEGHRRLNERNASLQDPAHVFRFSLLATVPDLETSLEQKRFPIAERRGQLRIVASQDGRKDSLRIRLDALLYSSRLTAGQHRVYSIAPGCGVWFHVVEGEIHLAGHTEHKHVPLLNASIQLGASNTVQR